LTRGFFRLTSICVGAGGYDCTGCFLTGNLAEEVVMFVITGRDGSGKTWYWRKWTGACSSGHPKWVERFSPKCIYAQRKVAEKTAAGSAVINAFRKGDPVPLSDVRVL